MVKQEQESYTKIGEFETNGDSFPVIKIFKNKDDEKPFNFGKAKAKLIVENFEAIKEFAEGNNGGGTKTKKKIKK